MPTQQHNSQLPHVGGLKDAKGKPVAILDPRALQKSNAPSPIPPDTLQHINTHIAPTTASLQRLKTIRTILFYTILIAGAAILINYIRAADEPDIAFYILIPVQTFVVAYMTAFILGLFSFRFTGKIATGILKHHHCPHCGHSLAETKPDRSSRFTRCPNCSHTWSTRHFS